MRKINNLGIVLGVLLIVSACGTTPNNPPVATTTNNDLVTPTSTTQIPTTSNNVVTPIISSSTPVKLKTPATTSKPIIIKPPIIPKPVSPPTPVVTPSPVVNKVIIIQNFAFSPASITIKQGTTVTWTNLDSAPHQIKADTFNSRLLSQGQSFSFTFNTTGTFNYICAIHPMMTGQIVVN